MSRQTEPVTITRAAYEHLKCGADLLVCVMEAIDEDARIQSLLNQSEGYKEAAAWLGRDLGRSPEQGA